MIAKQTFSLLVVSAVAAVGWFASAAQPATLRADAATVLLDSDDDLLPDMVEWAVLTNSASPDTDGDGLGDFVEVVQRGSPRHPGSTRPVDHEMRVVVTAPSVGGGSQPAWLHLLFRFVGTSAQLTSLNTWIELPSFPGAQFPLSILAFESIVVRQRVTANDGVLAVVSLPMVSESLLRALLPCTFTAEASIGGRALRTATKLIDVNGATSTLVPFGQRFAVQTIAAQALPSGVRSNRLCLLELSHAGSGPGGDVYEVTDADCEDCNELECSPACPQSIGWVITVPGGLEVITGG